MCYTTVYSCLQSTEQYVLVNTLYCILEEQAPNLWPGTLPEVVCDATKDQGVNGTNSSTPSRCRQLDPHQLQLPICQSCTAHGCLLPSNLCQTVSSVIYGGVNQVVWSEAVWSFCGEERDKLLLWAAQKGAVEELRALLMAGADVGVRDHFGWTALHRAAARGHVEVVRWLLRAGADVGAAEYFEQLTPLHMAAIWGHEYVVWLLLVASDPPLDCNYPDVVDTCGRTPLHWAAVAGNATVVSMLLEAGADKAARNNAGTTALDFAIQENHHQVVDLLQSSLQFS
ncbi:ankyrin repeat domain-containing protein 65-like [Schistocerca nitens]|uniref:ankyrin repeat domain-containing protein 65-like n=1 Tax=Schistocerca nitens TaxID=7011 RepID=UPI002117F6B2|nr:ankyrin repeat domain-containing protein 65-like [Schistocerca nitens]